MSGENCMQVASVDAATSRRLLSIDVFRGFDMMMIVGIDAIMKALDAWISGSPGWLTAQFSHPEWFGLSFYDTIFPTFIFIAGLSFPFSYARQVERGDGRGAIVMRIIRRTLALVALGMVYNGILRFEFADFRYASVLGKVGMAWGIAAVLYVFLGRRARIAVCAGILALYAVLLLTFVAPDYPGASPLSLEGNFVGWLDRMIQPGHLYQSNLCEPSGMVCNIFAVPTAMLGMFAGEIVRSQASSGARKTVHLLLLGAGLLAAGLAITLFIPLCKRLWTPSFTLCVGAYSASMFAAIYWVVDVMGWRRWTTFFTVIGMNSITIYLMHRFVDFKGISRFFLGGVAGHLSAEGGRVVLAVGAFLAGWLVLYFLYRKKSFFKV